MVITLDPFNHNNYGADATPQRGDTSENEPHNDSHETSYSHKIKLENLQKEEEEFRLNVSRRKLFF